MNKCNKYLSFANRNQWRKWLVENHAIEREAWLIHHKKNAEVIGLTYIEAVEEALCFGWIDGLLIPIDDKKYSLRYAPRKRRSIWSEHNKKRVETLIRDGRMTSAGLVKILEAKENGEWQAATQREDVNAIPTDLEMALQHNRDALEAFNHLAPSHKKQYLWWITSAKRDETRQRRIRKMIDLLTPRK